MDDQVKISTLKNLYADFDTKARSDFMKITESDLKQYSMATKKNYHQFAKKAIETINKDNIHNGFTILKNLEKKKIQNIETGVNELDSKLKGGLSRERITELLGKPLSGKSLLL